MKKIFYLLFLVLFLAELNAELTYDTTLKYLKSIKSQVTNAYENDIDLDEIIDYLDTQEFSTLKNYKSLNGRNIYNYYMQL